MKTALFTRNELKFLINAEKYNSLLRYLQPYVERDWFGDKKGFYQVTSLYYDTSDLQFYHEYIDRKVFRKKLRLRVYNHSTSTKMAFLEIKKKHKGIVNKRRVGMPLRDAYRFLEDGQMPEGASRGSVHNEVDFMRRFLDLHPRVVITYNRQAFKCKADPDLRVTFDSNLGVYEHDSRRLSVERRSSLFLPGKLLVMEVKVSSAVPYWLSRILSSHSCFDQGFSKYGRSVQYLEESHAGEFHKGRIASG